MKTEIFELEVNGHLLSALINGDESGLNEKDKKDINSFLSSLEAPNTYLVFSVGHDGDDEESAHDSFFARCDIGGLHADCVNLTVTRVTKE